MSDDGIDADPLPVAASVVEELGSIVFLPGESGEVTIAGREVGCKSGRSERTTDRRFLTQWAGPAPDEASTEAARRGEERVTFAAFWAHSKDT